jgi:hypothetical protein
MNGVVRLTAMQTKALTRLCKKVEVETMAFENYGETGEVIFVVTDKMGWSAAVKIGPTGDLDSIQTKTGRELKLSAESLYEIFTHDPYDGLMSVPGVDLD